ncbi:LOW QUALITY PROTEIN: heat shock transcription factor, X-linked-like [Trichechus inunguis]
MDSRSPPGRGPGSGMTLSPPRTWAPQIGCEDPAPPAVLAQAWDNRLPPGCPNGRFLLQETAFQTPTKRSSLKRPPSPDTPSARKGILFPLPFPKKLNILSSDQFVSIWWECNSTCVGINEKLFQKEILEREGADKVFVTQRMKSFSRQLNLYIFSKGHHTAWRPACLTPFFTEERAVCALSKLHFSCCPYLQRDFPELLLKMKIRVGVTAASKTVSDTDSQQVARKPEARRSPSAPAAPDAVAAAPTQLSFVVHTGDAAQMGSSGLMVCVSSPPAMLFHCWANCPCFSGYMAPIVRPRGALPSGTPTDKAVVFPGRVQVNESTRK